MYAVVKNSKNAYYTVCKKWLTKINEDGKIYAYFPSAAKMSSCLKNHSDVKNKWKFEEVEVKLDNISDLISADEFISQKVQHENSEASELDRTQKPKKRTLKVREPSLDDEDMDFNRIFDEQAMGGSSTQKKGKFEEEQQLLDQKVPCNDLSERTSLNETLSAHLDSNISNDRMSPEDLSIPSTSQNVSTNRLISGHASKIIMVRQNVLENIIHDIDAIKKRQEVMMKQMDTFMITIRDEFKSLRGLIHSGNNSVLDLTYKPPVIATLDDLKEMEQKIERMEQSFLDDYKKMFNYFTTSITRPNKSFTEQNGYIHSLMQIYLQKDFAKSLSWASTKLKPGFDTYKNHIKFFYLVCNKIGSRSGRDIFNNLTETENAIQKYFKSIHQGPRKEKGKITSLSKDLQDKEANSQTNEDNREQENSDV